MYVEAVRIPESDEEIHITGLGFSGPNTLCGITDDETPTCTACIEVYDSIKSHRPRFKFK